MSDATHTPENDAPDREMKAFLAGWFAHARNRQRLVVEDAWHAYRIGDLCPGCLAKPCKCPVDEEAARAMFNRVIPPEVTGGAA